MELWLVVKAADGERREVAVEIGSERTAGELADALAHHLGLTKRRPVSTKSGDRDRPSAKKGRRPATGRKWRAYCDRLGTDLDPEASIANTGLRTGDEITIVDSSARTVLAPLDFGRTFVVDLVIVGGPVAAGRRVPLTEGHYTVGRGADAAIILDDPELSRRHLRVVVKGERIVIADLESTNGSFIDGNRLDGERLFRAGEVIEAGASLLTFERHQRKPPLPPLGRDGRVPFNRPPRVVSPASEKVYRLPPPPNTPSGTRLPIQACLAPLLMGAVVFLIDSSYAGVMVAMMAVSAVMAAFSAIGERRGGKKQFGKAQAEFRSRLAELEQELTLVRTDETARRRAGSPDATDLASRARTLSANLWERRPRDDDFLSLRAGFADQPSDIPVQFEEGGDPGLRGQADTVLARFTTVPSVPIAVPLGKIGVLGVSGPCTAVSSLGRWLAVQAAVLHSPRDLVMMAALTDAAESDWAWLAWMPHLHSDESPLEGSHLVAGRSEALDLINRLVTLVDARRADTGSFGQQDRVWLPRILVTLDERLDLPRGPVAKLLAEGPQHGIAVVWLGGATRDLPGECRGVAELLSDGTECTVTYPETGVRIRDGRPDGLSADVARRIALDIAAVRDTSARGARGQIPRHVSLVDVLELDTISAEEVAVLWSSGEGRVAAPVGAGASGPFVVAMRQDGPHALLGGTTGSGKSELLQTLVASLALTHSPERLNFLLVDYKGGSAFKDCAKLPHTVGLVTDLDGHLVHRALTSLNAELKRRETLLHKAHAKDLLEMERREPESAPPSLLLVVDEFATLAKELPEFVDGVVDVAQRGRSLGIHLVLATQRPQGVINDNVRGNTNLRMALRVNDVLDSEDVLGARDAAFIPRSLPGRAFARTGQGELTEFQTAFVGGHSANRRAPVKVTVADLHLGRIIRPAQAQASESDGSPTDLQVMAEAISQASGRLGLRTQPPPWLPALPPVVPLSSLALSGDDGIAVIGLVDEPKHQRQSNYAMDLETDGSLLVYGTSGSGKTSLLRTIAASLASSASPEEVHIYALDFATRGLGSLEALPHCGAVIAGDDVERVSRLFNLVGAAIERRKAAFASAGVSALSEYRRAGSPGGPLPRIVVLLDSYGGFASTFEKVDFGELIDVFPRLVSDGRPLGVHFVVTADRRGAVGGGLAGVVQRRVVLRMADDDDYATLNLDLRTARETTLPPGRGFVGLTLEMQAALVGSEPEGNKQLSALDQLGRELAERFGPGTVPKIGLLPMDVPRASLPASARELEVVIGLGDRTLEAVTVNLEDGHFLVTGPHRSGRTTALATIASSLRETSPGLDLRLYAPRRTVLTSLRVWTSVAKGADPIEDAATELEAAIHNRSGSEPPIVIVIDDGEELVESSSDPLLETIAKRGRDVGVTLVAAIETQAAHRVYGGWLSEVRKERHGLLLTPDVDVDGDLLGVRLPRRTSAVFPPGRGYLVQRGVAQVVQFAVT